MTRYIWQLPQWPDLEYRIPELLIPVGKVKKLQGELRSEIRRAGLSFTAEQVET